MSKNKEIIYHSNWHKIASNKDDSRNNETYKKSCELINIDNITFGGLVRLKEYNKSLYKLWEFLNLDENKHIIRTLSKDDGEFYSGDLMGLYFHIDSLCRVGLQDEKNVDDWTVFSGGNIGRKSKQKVHSILPFQKQVNTDNEKGVK